MVLSPVLLAVSDYTTLIVNHHAYESMDWATLLIVYEYFACVLFLLVSRTVRAVVSGRAAPSVVISSNISHLRDFIFLTIIPEKRRSYKRQSRQSHDTPTGGHGSVFCQLSNRNLIICF